MRCCPQCFQLATGAVAVCEPCKEEFLDIPEIHYVEEADFRHPDWVAFQKAVKASVSTEQDSLAWKIAVRLWLNSLVEDLGGNYQIHENAGILLLCEDEAGSAQLFLDFVKDARIHILHLIKEPSSNRFDSPTVILVFSEEDDYLSYISHFYPEGENPSPIGNCIYAGYIHIAVVIDNLASVFGCLAHELAHYTLAYNSLPKWIDEAFAITVERILCNQSLTLDHETADRLRSFWNENNIQLFWSGESFNIPGDANELSYELAPVLWQLMCEHGNQLLYFLSVVRPDDAGQNAAVNCFGVGLETFVEKFLGPGNWRPDRRKLAESFQRARSESPTSE